MVFYLCSCSVTIPKYKRLGNFKEKNGISYSNWKLGSLQFRATSGEGRLANGDSLRCSEVHDMVRRLMRYGQPGFNGRPVLVRIKPLTQSLAAALQSLPNATTMYDFEDHIRFFLLFFFKYYCCDQNRDQNLRRADRRKSDSFWLMVLVHDVS